MSGRIDDSWTRQQYEQLGRNRKEAVQRCLLGRGSIQRLEFIALRQDVLDSSRIGTQGSFGFLAHPIDLFGIETARSLDLDLVLLVGVLVASLDRQDAVLVERERHLDLRFAARRRATSAAAAAPNNSIIGGAGTGVGSPDDPPWLLLPPELDEEEDDELLLDDEEDELLVVPKLLVPPVAPAGPNSLNFVQRFRSADP